MHNAHRDTILSCQKICAQILIIREFITVELNKDKSKHSKKIIEDICTGTETTIKRVYGQNIYITYAQIHKQ